MKEELYQLVNDFADKLSEWEFNQYVSKIRDYFIPYLIEIVAPRAKNNIEKLFREELLPSDLRESCKRYVLMNDNVTSESSVDDYFIALNQFFDLILSPKYRNETLIRLKPFNNFGAEVIVSAKEAGKELNKATNFRPITRIQYRTLLSNLLNSNFTSFKDKQMKLFLELILLYGFSINRMKSLSRNSIKESGRILTVTSAKYTFVSKYYLELPLEIARDINDYLLCRKDSNDLLFITEEETIITAAFPSYYLDKIKALEAIKGTDTKRLNNRGIAMYAVSEMLKSGIPATVVMDITGQGPKIISSCQEEIFTSKGNQNSDFNIKMRSLETYDEFQRII